MATAAVAVAAPAATARSGPVLRPYQREAIDAVYRWVLAHEGNCLVVLPTGSGKSLVMGTLAAEALGAAPHVRVLILAHRKELLSQNARAVATAMPLGQIGIYSAGLNRRDTTSPVIVAGIQSMARKPHALGAFDLVLVDEAHLVPTADDTMYRKTIEALRIQNPHVRFVGLTATPYRLTTGLLHRGPGALFTDVAYEANVADLIAAGYLCPLISKATLARLNVAGVATRGGEYVPGQLEEAVDKEELTGPILDELCTLGADRRKWLLFCAGVAHAEHVAAALNDRGIPAAAIHGELTPFDRARILEEFKAGVLRAVTSMDVLTTGYDEPAIDLIALLRPTKSTGLYCLDEETEILTREGWKRHDQVGPHDVVAAPDPGTFELRWLPITGKIVRDPLPGEQLIKYSSPGLNFAVSDKHRMIWRARPRSAATSRWRISTADKLLERKSEFELPVSAWEQTPDAPLTDDEIRFVGWVLTDGSINPANGAVTITQSERYPEHLEEIRRVLRSCGFKFGERVVRPQAFGKEHRPSHRFTVSKGKPRGRDRQLRGWAELEPWLDKSFAPALHQLSLRQFTVLLEAMHLGDGAKQRGQTWTRRSYHISTGNQVYANRLQALAVCRGWSCSLAVHRYNKSPLYVLHLRQRQSRSIAGGCMTERDYRPTVYADEPQGKLWCVENEAGTLITRRRGRVLVTGNCQMVGRGFRLHPAKQNTLVLDFAKNVETHGPVDAITVEDAAARAASKSGDSEPLAKACTQCQSLNPLTARTCRDCGHEFPPPPPPKPTIDPQASTASILTSEPPVPTWHEVADVRYYRHQAKDEMGIAKTPTLRVEYYGGLGGFKRIASEWVCLEHEGFPRRKAETWWRERSPEASPEVPASIESALLATDDLLTPEAIATIPDGKWTRIVDYRFPGQQKKAPNGLPQACWTCAHWLPNGERCQKWNATPPADVQKLGCDAWEDVDDQPLPF